MNRRSTAPDLQLQTATLCRGAWRSNQQWQLLKEDYALSCICYTETHAQPKLGEGMGSSGFELLQYMQLSIDPRSIAR